MATFEESNVKSIKMFSLSAFMWLMAMTSTGASTAMAEGSALCTADEVPCAVGNTVIHFHESTTAKAKLLTSFLTVECNVLFLGEMLTALNASGTVTIDGNFTYTNCGSCTVTETSFGSFVEVLREGHETARVTGEGSMHAVCGTSLDCEYNHEGLIGTARGPLLSFEANGELTITNQTLHRIAGGFLCPKTAKLDITTTPLAAMYISR